MCDVCSNKDTHRCAPGLSALLSTGQQFGYDLCSVQSWLGGGGRYASDASFVSCNIVGSELLELEWGNIQVCFSERSINTLIIFDENCHLDYLCQVLTHFTDSEDVLDNKTKLFQAGHLCVHHGAGHDDGLPGGRAGWGYLVCYKSYR